MGKPLRALIVEDDPHFAKFLANYLTAHDYDVTWDCVDTAEGLRTQLASSSWDVVLSDYCMGGFDGLEALRIVQESDLDLPFIILTASVGEDVVAEVMRAGAHDYLLKDNLTRLVPAIERELQEAEVRRERREGLAALRASEARIRFVINQMPAILWTMDPDLRVTSSMGAGLAAIGRSSDDIVGRTMYEDGMPPHVLDAVRRALNGESVSFELEHRCRVLQSHAEPLRNGQGAITGVIGVARDATERKEAEERLRKSEEHYRQLVETSPDAIFVTDPEANISMANQQGALLVGHARPAELVGCSAFQFIASEEHQRARADVQRILETGEVRSVEYTVVRREGARIPVEVSASLLRDGGGNPAGIMAVVRDITERQQTRQQLADYASRLRERSRRLVEMQESERRHIARELHDEVGQVLTGLGVAVEMTRREVDGAAAERLEAAQEMVRELFGRIRELSLDLRPVMLDNLGLLPALQDLFGRFERRTGVQVAFSTRNLDRRFPPEAETAAFRIVQEGLSNVARHAQADRVAVRLTATPSMIRIHVQDAGRGFEAGSLAAQRRSTGLLGMRERAELLGGRFHLRSSPGRGTRLSIEIPIARTPDPGPASPGSPRRGRAILVVEDDPVCQEVLVTMLSAEGYHVTAASDGYEALERLRSAPAPDLILLDLLLPNMDGWELRDRMKGDPALAAIPVVVMSGAGRVDRLAASVDACAYVEKPADLRKVREIVARCCGPGAGAHHA